MIARLIAVDDDLGSLRETVLISPAPEQGIRTSALHHPYFLDPVRLGHFHVNPGMGIHPFDLHNLALEQDRAVRVELSAKGVMSLRPRQNT